MRFRPLLLTSLLALAACASAPAGPAAPAAPGAAPAASAAEAMLRGAGGARAATLEAVERALGPADVSRRDGRGAALTYRYETCALLLIFAADSRGALRLAQANPGARRANEPAPDLAVCAAQAQARRDEAR
ncbi:MAG: hypothetical protein AB7L65_05710 [Hyphomonadaceae bacterium]